MGSAAAATGDVLLVVSDDGRDDYGAYTSRILSMEGLSHATVPLADVDWNDLPGCVVLAADLPLTRREASALADHAHRGGRVVALFPHPHGAEEFGFAPAYRTTVGGTLRLGTPGFADAVVQWHGALRHLIPPAGAEVHAATCDEGAPALVRLPIGRGEAWFVMCDLPRSIALTRQGDPLRAGLHGNLVAPGWRPADRFAGHLDPRCALLPQADLQCHLLRHIVCAPRPAAAPVPFVWYFPDGAPTVLTVTSDDDWSTPEQFEEQHDALGEAGAATTYYLVKETSVTPARLEAWSAEGHTFSVHPNHREPLRRTWRETVRGESEAFGARFGRPPGRTIRHHAIPCVGYVRSARWDAEAGFDWESNHFSVPPHATHYMTGGGLPLPLVDVSGELLPVTQAPAQFSDETTLAAGGFGFSLGLDTGAAVELIVGMMRANLEDHHSLLCVNTHPVSFATYSGPMWRAVLREAARLGVPRLGLESFADWWERRRQVCIGAGRRTGERWQWDVDVPDGAGSIWLAVPGAVQLSASWDASPAESRLMTVHGAPHLLVRLPGTAGRHVLSAGADPSLASRPQAV